MTKEEDKCNLCEKDRKGFDGMVWYSGNVGTELCRSCLMKWNKTQEYKALKEKHKDAKPTTTAWHKMCEEQQKAFDKWYYANGGIDA